MKRKWIPSAFQIIFLGFFGFLVFAFVYPVCQLINENSKKQVRQLHLRSIGQGLIKANQQNISLSQAICRPNGRQLLSWRVAVLPFLDDSDAKAIYQQFKLDEPWDSPSNYPLLAKMPKVFQSPGMEAPENHTYFQVFVTGTGYEKGKFRPLWNPCGPMNHAGSFSTIPDGPAATILLAEAGRPVPWTKPEDIIVDQSIEDDQRGFDFKVDMFKFKPGYVYFNVVMADGSVRAMTESMYVDRNKFMKKLIRPFIGYQDGEPIDDGMND